ncbi:UNKNOWN [Stylonychia lemnae]|uniref:Uncharacterized protein n=1 Tax=Stylonychia lemnae TaxID=5949 RepID=A0A078A5Q2_STYLE|nr:UNKNOWN [Stylonychia lemnae]|eukprot:CDW77514.1 UNKNOWN [Stylonychia lemnae]
MNLRLPEQIKPPKRFRSMSPVFKQKFQEFEAPLVYTQQIVASQQTPKDGNYDGEFPLNSNPQVAHFPEDQVIKENGRQSCGNSNSESQLIDSIKSTLPVETTHELDSLVPLNLLLQNENTRLCLQEGQSQNFNEQDICNNQFPKSLKSSDKTLTLTSRSSEDPPLITENRSTEDIYSENQSPKQSDSVLILNQDQQKAQQTSNQEETQAISESSGSNQDYSKRDPSKFLEKFIPLFEKQLLLNDIELPSKANQLAHAIIDFSKILYQFKVNGEDDSSPINFREEFMFLIKQVSKYHLTIESLKTEEKLRLDSYTLSKIFIFCGEQMILGKLKDVSRAEVISQYVNKLKGKCSQGEYCTEFFKYCCEIDLGSGQIQRFSCDIFEQLNEMDSFEDKFTDIVHEIYVRFLQQLLFKYIIQLDLLQIQILYSQLFT